MGVDFSIVVSSENSAYLAWQTQLFCFSALTRLGKCPTVVVHRANGSMRPEFEIVRDWGCRVIEAPSYSSHPLAIYPPRNELGSLLTIADHPDFCDGYVLFCEPDMLFATRSLDYPDELCGECHSYLNYSEVRIRDVAQRFGVSGQVEMLGANLMVGLPYLIPTHMLPRIAQRWIEVLDSFAELKWIDIMYAFGIAAVIENLPIKMTHLMADNFNPMKPLDCSIIHYCYGDAQWSKRAFKNGRSPLERTEPIPSLEGCSGTIFGELYKQIREVRACAQLPFLGRLLTRAARMLNK